MAAGTNARWKGLATSPNEQQVRVIARSAGRDFWEGTMPTDYRFEGPPGTNSVTPHVSDGRAIKAAKIILRNRCPGDLVKVLSSHLKRRGLHRASDV